ncbi:NUDIX hydrolase domain-like protein, partial [Abortiporus biennis]
SRWIKLKKINWEDPTGKQRVWESAERTTTSSGGIDAVAVLAILRSQSRKFPPSTIIIEQFRPPVGKFVVELPAGLIDEGETPEQAAFRELEEETGYVAKKVLQSTPLYVSDPGMSNANMKLVTVDVPFEDELQIYEQKLDAGEFIVRRVVPIDGLVKELEGGFVVDAKLGHFASGYEMAQKLQKDI